MLADVGMVKSIHYIIQFVCLFAIWAKANAQNATKTLRDYKVGL